MFVLQKGLPSGRLWKEENIATKKFIIPPWNPSGCHWTLVGVNLHERKIVYVDPMKDVDVNNSTLVQLLATVMRHVLRIKFGMSDFTIISPPHTLQADSSSCGVLVCWFALQFVQEKSLTDSCNTNAMRVAIYNQIRGICLRRYIYILVNCSLRRWDSLLHLHLTVQ